MASRNPKTRIGLVGPRGRLGQAIGAVLSATDTAPHAEITLALSRENGAALASRLSDVDVFLDVSVPAAAEKYLAELIRLKARTPYVIGCTGWTDAQMKVAHTYAKQACVVFAPNFAPGVNLFLGLIEQAAPLLEKWGYDVSIHETHHTRKLDAPSGTAKAIVERLGKMKPQIHATRAGNIIGTHEVRFVGANDILTLTHEALDRSIFARGAVMAAEWAGRHAKPGMYSMKEVIFESS